jgi:hypothetical protein
MRAAEIKTIGDELRARLALYARLDELNLSEVDPALTFDPRW